MSLPRTLISRAGVALAALLLVSCASVPELKVQLEWAGIYSLKGEGRRIADPNSPSGERFVHPREQIPSNLVVQRTTEVEARIGTNFGIGYSFEGAVAGSWVTHRVVLKYPPPGLMNATTSRRFEKTEWEQQCPAAQACLAGWAFEHRWELVPGTWVVEVWIGTQRVLEQPFNVSVKGA